VIHPFEVRQQSRKLIDGTKSHPLPPHLAATQLPAQVGVKRRPKIENESDQNKNQIQPSNPLHYQILTHRPSRVDSPRPRANRSIWIATLPLAMTNIRHCPAKRDLALPDDQFSRGNLYKSPTRPDRGPITLDKGVLRRKTFVVRFLRIWIQNKLPQITYQCR